MEFETKNYNEENSRPGKNKYKIKLNGLAMCKRSMDFGPFEGMKVDIFNTDFPNGSPYVIYFGKDGEKISIALRKLKVKLAILTSSSRITASKLIRSAKDFTKFIFRKAEEENSRGVYFCGLEIGCSLISKILADRHLLEELPSTNLMSGVFLFAGLYDTNLENQIPEFTSLTKKNIPVIENNPQTLIQNIIDEHKAFECRTNCSPVCDYFTYESLPIQRFLRSRSVMIKKKDPEIISSQFQQSASMRKEKRNKIHPWSSESSCEIEFPFVDKEELEFLSSKLDDHSHCVKSGVRIYIIAAGEDGRVLIKQSRDLYVKLVEHFDHKDLHYEVKFDVNMAGMRNYLMREDSALVKLLDYDLKKKT